MEYVALVAGAAALILGLLWRIEVQKRKRFQLQKEIAEQAANTLRELLRLERQLRVSGGIDRKKLENEIKLAEKKIADAKTGEQIDDIFGTTSGEEGR